jgi:hypothetical protein
MSANIAITSIKPLFKHIIITANVKNIALVVNKLIDKELFKKHKAVCDEIWSNFVNLATRYFSTIQDVVNTVLLKIYMYIYDCWYINCAFDAQYAFKGFHSLKSTFTIFECTNKHYILDVIYVFKE